jgi:hypothetical protein
MRLSRRAGCRRASRAQIKFAAWSKRVAREFAFALETVQFETAAMRATLVG